MPGLSPTPSRLLMTADTIGGVWTYALDLAQGLAPFGIEIALATMGAPLSSNQRAAVERLGNVTVFPGGYKLEWMDNPWADVDAAGEWLLNLEAHFAPDVVHLNGYAHGALAWRAPVLIGAHSCVLSWWQAVKGESAPERYGTYRGRVAEGLRKAGLVVAPTQAMLSALHEAYGPFSHGRVIPNGRDGARFKPGPKTPVILTAGRVWDEAKNIPLLDAVAPRLDWPVYVAGETRRPGGPEGKLRNIRPLGILDAEVLAGWFSRAAIFALPARYEPFGLSALEAALCGCALVLGDIPSLREVWDDAALFVAPGDGNALCATINALASRKLVCEELGARARRRALFFTHHDMAASYMSAYVELMGKRQAREVPA